MEEEEADNAEEEAAEEDEEVEEEEEDEEEEEESNTVAEKNLSLNVQDMTMKQNYPQMDQRILLLLGRNSAPLTAQRRNRSGCVSAVSLNVGRGGN